MSLHHSFATPVIGSVCVWAYDSMGGATLYDNLTLENSTRSAFVSIQDSDGSNYYAGIGGSNNTKPRSLGWHKYDIVVTSYSVQCSIDDDIVFTSNTVFQFDYMQMYVSGPSWRPNNTFYYDDFSCNLSSVVTDAPSIPQLVLPANNAVSTQTAVALDWNDSTDAESEIAYYELQVATSSAFNFLFVSSVVVASNYNVSLNDGINYYWRVRAKNTAGNYSAWSSVRQFIFTINEYAYSDNFDSSFFTSFWSKTQTYGSIIVSTAYARSGTQSVALKSASGGERYMYLYHNFTKPVYGTVSSWFYDPMGGQTLYSQLAVEYASATSRISVGVQDWDETYYHANWDSAGGTTAVLRTAGWHKYEITWSSTSVTILLDSTLVYSTSSVQVPAFDKVQLEATGPPWRPNVNFYYDDFILNVASVSSSQPPSAATNLTATPLDGRFIRLDWTKSASSSASNYRVYCSTDPNYINYSTPIDTVAHPLQAWTSQAFTAGKNLYFVLRAADASGNEEHNTAIVSATPAAKLGEYEFSDNFDASALNPFWSKTESYGTISISTANTHFGAKALCFKSVSGGQRELPIRHNFATPVIGSVRVWAYDSMGGATLYDNLTLENSTRSLYISIQDFDGANYYAGIGSVNSVKARSLGWHKYDIVVTSYSVQCSIDDTVLFTSNTVFQFDFMQMYVSGPNWRPNNTFYYDDFYCNFSSVDIKAPSIPELVSPAMASQTAQTAIAFDWTDSTDPDSGVSFYELQISTDQQFGVLSCSTITVISQFNKTLTAGAGYFWRVRAVDNVLNISDWSSISTFSILLPVQLSRSDKIMVKFKPNYNVVLVQTQGIMVTFTPNYIPVVVYPEPVADLAAEPLDGAKIKLTWAPSTSGDASVYTIYYATTASLLDYSSPQDVVSHPEAIWTSPALTAGKTYYFVVRTVNASGNEETNTNAVSATALGSLSGIVKTSIKIPQNGKKISGNRLMVMAEITAGKESNVKQVLFEYKNNNESTTWTIIPVANNNHENPDTKAPYFIQWDVHNLAAGKYNIRAVATDIYDNPDPSPGYITVTADHNDPDVCEKENEKGEHEKQEKVCNQKDNTIKASENDNNKITQLNLPKGCMDIENTKVTVVVNPVITVSVPERFAHIHEFREITLENGKLQGEAELLVQYKDDDNDDILDGTNIPTNSLCVYSYNVKEKKWEKLPSSVNKDTKTVKGRTTHFSLFALFGAPASDLAGIKVYPNPFKPSKGHTFVKFDNLTANTKIQIFTLAGDLVFEKEAIDYGDYTWTAVNQAGRDVASGIYICMIMNDLGEKRIVKIAVIR